MEQKTIRGIGSCTVIADVLNSIESKRFLLVCDKAFEYLGLSGIFDKLVIPFTVFNGFSPNPIYEDVVSGVELFNQNDCDAILAIGGGSTIDTAKCIKLFCRMNKSDNYLDQPFVSNGIPLLAVPTTAGTGSESTRFAVIYRDGIKQSITHDSIVPEYAILDSSLLKTLPLYQKKCTMLDAMCQAIESWWSVHSTTESIGYASHALKLIVEHYNEYLKEDGSASALIMEASNLAGRAINITQTTAAHAMSYKLTSKYGLPHGHAVALCLPEIWEYMYENLSRCTDARGAPYLTSTFNSIAFAMNDSSVRGAVKHFRRMLDELCLFTPNSLNVNDIDLLVSSVNLTRLNNNPVMLDKNALHDLYTKIITGD